MSLDCAACPVRDRAACSVLDAGQRDLLARSGRSRRLERGETLFAAGEAGQACATLISGALKIVSRDAEGDERILALVHPAGFVGEMFAPFAHHDVVALTTSELCLFRGADFETALDSYPALAKALFKRSQEELVASRELLALTAQRSARSRVGGAILALARAASNSPCHPATHFDLPLSRGELADLLGLTIESVSRALGALEGEGAIRRGGKRGIELLDPALLSD